MLTNVMNRESEMDSARAHFRAGHFAEAEESCRKILAHWPNYAEALHLLGLIAFRVQQIPVALKLINRALEIAPDMAAAHHNLGKIFLAMGRASEAIGSCQRAVLLDPRQPGPRNDLGIAFGSVGKMEEALDAFRECLLLSPDYADAHSNLARVLSEIGRNDESIAACRRCLEFHPRHLNAQIILGTAYFAKGAIDEAIAEYQKALSLDSTNAEAYNNLGMCYRSQGQLDEAIEACRHAVRLRPDWAAAHSNLLLTLHYHERYDPRALGEEHHQWQVRHAGPLARFRSAHENVPDPLRRLRIGYVSGDFREHPVARFFLPLLRGRDRTHFEIFCYSNTPFADKFTDEVRRQADEWRNIRGVSDESVAELIRRDGIDILVDLSAHTAHNRLLLFARKPAPIQITYLAYCSTTGLDTIDYRISDAYLDPLEEDGASYSEKTLRLRESYWCYLAPPFAPKPNALPSETKGYVTFGCLNNFAKATKATLMLWARVLQAVPGSRLLLHAAAGRHRETVRDLFAGRGINAEQITFVDRLQTARYFALYHEIDIGLDPFPFGGGTTTCDALWMGVPVISLAGKTAVSRAGLSLLSNIGLPEFAAQSEGEYIEIAKTWANDPHRLSELRRVLRSKMEESGLMDAVGFARNVEETYRAVWRRWCESRDNA